MKKHLVSLLSILVASHFAFAAAAPKAKLEALVVTKVVQSANLMPGPGRPHPVHSVITAEVMSNGCTRPEDFRVDVKRTEEGQHVTIVRVNPDLCEALRPNFEVELETTGLAPYAPIFISNPLSVVQHFSH